MSPASSPAASHDRCAARADRRGDTMLGTAFPAARLLLVEQPFPWGPEGLRTSRFDSEIALAVEARCRTEGIRVQAIRRRGPIPRDGARPPRSWAIIDARPGVETQRWGHFHDDRELLDIPLDGSAGTLKTTPNYLVCTHGRHDPCCGQLGRPVIAALAAMRPDDVWQTSHIGGCRFAPSVLVLPTGLVYGRVPLTAISALVAATDAGELLPAHLRGRIGMPATVQAALAYAHEQLELPAHRDVVPVSNTPLDESSVQVRVATPRGDFVVTVRRERVDAAGLTCAFPQASWFIAHEPVAIVPASG